MGKNLEFDLINLIGNKNDYDERYKKYSVEIDNYTDIQFQFACNSLFASEIYKDYGNFQLYEQHLAQARIEMNFFYLYHLKKTGSYYTNFWSQPKNFKLYLP